MDNITQSVKFVTYIYLWINSTIDQFIPDILHKKDGKGFE